MKIEEQGKGYLNVKLQHEGTFDFVVLDKIKSLECILPFQIRADEENSISYHIGEFITLIEYLNMKVLSFEEVKGIFLSCIEGFERIEQCGGHSANIVEDLYHIFIDPVTREIHFIYCPVAIELNPNSFCNLMKELLFTVQTQDAEMILGVVAENISIIQKKEDDIGILKNSIQNITGNVKIIEKKVEVERIVEKVIEKPVEKSNNFGKKLTTCSVIYLFSMIFLPMLLSNYLNSNLLTRPGLINIMLCIGSILLSVIIMLVTEREEQDDKIVVTMQSQEKMKNTDSKHSCNTLPHNK